MTFEARDSAAKVGPARLKCTTGHPHRHSKLSPAVSNKLHSSVRTDSRRSTSKWDQAAVYRGVGGSPAAGALDRRALTAAFIQFSKNLQQTSPVATTLSKSPSAPNLAETKSPTPSVSPYLKSHISPRKRPRRVRSSLHPSASGCTLLSPHVYLQRQALSMDNPDYNPYFSPPRSQQLSRHHSSKGSRESFELELGPLCQTHGSQASMTMDIHIPNECPITLRVKDKTKRSDTAKRHTFVRQSQINDDEDIERRETHSCSPRLSSSHSKAYDEIRPYSRSTPHSRRESLTKTSSMVTSMEEPPRSRSNTSESRRSSISKIKYSRSNMDETRRRSSTTSEKKRDGIDSRSSSYERRKHLEGQTSSSSVPGEAGSELGPDELEKQSDTFILIEEVDLQLPVVSGTRLEERESIVNVT